MEGLPSKAKIPVQTGGGIRDEAKVARLLEGGVGRVILGTRAFTCAGPSWTKIDYGQLFGPPVNRWFPGRNGVGQQARQSLRRSLEMVVSRYRENELRLTFTRLFLALKCYKAANGVLPASLDELVPEYLDEVPTDPYDGRQLRYSAERRLIWSVGEDGVDAGGLISGDDTNSLDLNEPTFEVKL